MTVLMKHGEMIHSAISYVKWYPIKMCFKANILTQFENSMILAPKVFVHLYVVLWTDISCLGGIFANNTSRETKNFPSRKASEI